MKNEKAKLSICIPTYNRAEMLSDLLDEIIKQADERVEIVISDNASSDNTIDIVNAAKLKFPNIIYFCWDSNQGPDVNFIKVVDLASGEYCWLLGSDDGIEDNGISYLLNKLADEDIVLLNLKECNAKLEPFSHHEWVNSDKDIEVFDFSETGSLPDFFNKVNPLMGLFFGYISSIVVKRESWKRIPFDKSYIGTFYSFVYILFGIINNGPKLKYIKMPIVLNRGYNDSMLAEFSYDAELKRMLLDVDAYILFSNLLTDTRAKKAFLRIGKKNFTWFSLLKLRAYMNKNKWKIERKRLELIGCNLTLLNFIGFTGIFKKATISLLKLKKKLLPQTRLIPRKLQ